MILFWILSGVIAAVALVLVARPFIRRNPKAGISRTDLNLSVYRDQLRELDADLAAGTLAQEDRDRARLEIDRRLLEDTDEAPACAPARNFSRARMAAAGLVVPVLALGVYFAVGNPGAVVPADPHAGMSITPQQVQAMVERLAAKLKDNPDDVNGWKLLGRSYMVMGLFKDAAQAYGSAARLAPNDAQLLTDLADALAMASGRGLQAEPEKLVLRALQIDPNNLKALALAGTAAFDRKDYAAASGYWSRMLPLVEPGSEDARTVQGNVDEARALAGQKAPLAQGLKGTVQLSPKLRDQAGAQDTVFIFARAAGGPPLPLAVLRKQVRDLPVRFTLDDSMAMAPGMNLSAHQKVIVGARISKSGNATAQPGDLQGLSSAVANDASGVTVTIDTVVR